ncbi:MULTISPECIES: PepSY-associated TM helix domain-containing protein [Methylosinus]|uniref:PepSY domain-containing protein n=1 Tax=Methylosinus trichosporium (strain ATCC 35070 / NCIMB 11131 / UNIQEM 75 / OB3b) TaxID=595536 RepID=A0A2D2CWR4_METT3|nr:MULTISPECIES: PepSY-associated TM helix domain-containing protein [Methylosinus]ATQ67201.1 PepSY domain-containing protein [Methylosinus trichosporium OB3b]OBS52217.1 peptidase [Methylosinus sp. 3S-1]
MTRAFFVWLHRWVGLTMAVFLIIVGLTGSLLAFLPELDHLLAPQVHPGAHPGIELDPATLLRRAEALAPEALVNAAYLGEPGVAHIGVEPKPDGKPLAFDGLILDRVTGEELGRLKWGGLPTTAAAIMPFVYSLHYELAMGTVGAWILGLIALAWTIDCFVGFYLTLPPPGQGKARSGWLARWKPAWLVKLRGSFYRINFDLHRASGLWLWAALLIFAWSSVYWNLTSVYTKATSLVFEYEPSVWARDFKIDPPPGKALLPWEEAQAIGARLMDEQARANGFTVEALNAFYLLRDKGLYQYRVRSTRDIGDKGGGTYVLVNAYTGEFVGLDMPSGQHTGNTITSWLAALHMAAVFGMPYRIFVSVLGVVIAMLSGTGVYIWWKKRKARVGRKAGATARAFEAIDA